VEPGADHRIHGFAVQTDLSRAVGFTEVIWLALTGELPNGQELEAFTLAMIWLAPVHVGEMPAHAIEIELDGDLERRWAEVCASARRWFGERPWFNERIVLRRVPAALALLHELGIRDAPRLQALLTIARLPVVLAEAACTPPGSVMHYPTSTPAYRYVEDET